jgi:type IV secretion system protein VirB6
MNPFSVLSTVDDTFETIYQALFTALTAQALNLAILMTLIWTAYIGVKITLGNSEPIMNYLWTYIGTLVIGQVALNWPVFATWVLPFVTEWPNEIARTISGGASTRDVFIGYYSDVGNTLDDISETLGWSGTGQIIMLGILGYVPLVIMSSVIVSLLLIAKVATAILIVLAPIFIILCIWESTRNLFMGWLRQVLNFMLITILVSAVLFISTMIFRTVAADLMTVEGFSMSRIMGLAIINMAFVILLSQIPMIATGIAGGMMISGAGLSSRINQYSTGRLDLMKQKMAPAAQKVAQYLGASSSGGKGAAGAMRGATSKAMNTNIKGIVAATTNNRN